MAFAAVGIDPAPVFIPRYIQLQFAAAVAVLAATSFKAAKKGAATHLSDHPRMTGIVR